MGNRFEMMDERWMRFRLRTPGREAFVNAVLLIAGLVFSQAAGAAPASAPAQAETEIRELQTRQSDAWNRHDAAAYARLFRDDGDVVNVVGWWWQGRPEIEKKLTAGFSVAFRESTLTITGVEVRLLTPVLAVAHVRWTMTGARTPPGVPEPKQGIQLQVLEKGEGGWRIVSFQNTSSIPEVPFPAGPPPASRAAPADTIQVTLLGTGSPSPGMNRFGPSILVEAGGQKLVFDAGRGALQRLTQVKVSWKDVQAVFLTHLHSDHVVGFPDLWLTGWLVGERDTPLRVFGPKGTRKMMSRLEEAYEYDIAIRISDDRASPQGAVILAQDIEGGVVYEKSGVKVTAFEVDHAPVKPAFGYRIDFAGRSVVLSGDTRVSENLIRSAQGCDLLIHEVAVSESFRRSGVSADHVKSIVGHHTTPEQAGEVFARVKPKLAVYSHIVRPIATEQDVIPATRTKYAGPLELGSDLMVIEVGDQVSVRRPDRPPS
ncbi:MAG: SgcJ/EcaC family oxidoreductase [Acidobacteriota bacterium]